MKKQEYVVKIDAEDSLLLQKKSLQRQAMYLQNGLTAMIQRNIKQAIKFMR